MLKVEQIFNHYSKDTAFLVTRYPSLFGKYCNIRYWVESHPYFGQKLRHQIQDIQTKEWYAAKDSSEGYKDIIILQRVIETDYEKHPFLECGHLKPFCINLSDLSLNHLVTFAEYYVFSEAQKQVIIKHFKNHNVDASSINWKDNSIIVEPVQEKRVPNPVGRPKLTLEQRQLNAIKRSAKYKEDSYFNISKMKLENVKTYFLQIIDSGDVTYAEVLKKFPEFFE
jgi:hypothetical protein